MEKADWPALLPAGVHRKTLTELANLAVVPFDSPRRDELFARLSVYLPAVAAFGCLVEAWVGGSFLTEKQNPDDIDLMLLLDFARVDAMPVAHQQALVVLLDRDVAKQRYRLDSYLEGHTDRDHRAYWRGLFGFAHDETTPKGIVVIEPPV